jgi:hypothetical protein
MPSRERGLFTHDLSIVAAVTRFTHELRAWMQMSKKWAASDSFVDAYRE